MCMKAYEAVFDENGTQKGVFSISLVENPAMESKFVALKKQEHKIQFAEVDKKQFILAGLVLEAGKVVPRVDEETGEEFTIKFSKDTVRDLCYAFTKNKFNSNSTEEHNKNAKIHGVHFVENWIVRDPKKDTALSLGLDVKEGDWISVAKCDNKEIYQKCLNGEFKGFSIDAMLNLKEIKLNKENKMEDTIKAELKTSFAKMKDEILVALNLKKKEVEIKLGSLKSADGSITFNYEGDTPQVGQAIWIMAEDGTRVPVPAGEIPLEDGSILVVEEEGIIAAIRMPEENGDQELEKDTTGNSDANSVISQVQESIKSIMIKYKKENDKKFTDFETKFTDLKKENEDLKKEVLELSEQPASKPIKSTVAQREPNTKRERLTVFLNNRN